MAHGGSGTGNHARTSVAALAQEVWGEAVYFPHGCLCIAGRATSKVWEVPTNSCTTPPPTPPCAGLCRGLCAEPVPLQGNVRQQRRARGAAGAAVGQRAHPLPEDMLPEVRGARPLFACTQCVAWSTGLMPACHACMPACHACIPTCCACLPCSRACLHACMPACLHAMPPASCLHSVRGVVHRSHACLLCLLAMPACHACHATGLVPAPSAWCGPMPALQPCACRWERVCVHACACAHARLCACLAPCPRPLVGSEPGFRALSSQDTRTLCPTY